MASAETTTHRRKLKFTKTSVAALPVPVGRPAIYWDTDDSAPGFGLRISPRGRRVFFLQARTKAGRGVKITCGVADRVTPDQARAKAKKCLAQIELEGDPAAELRAKRQAERERKAAKEAEDRAPTVDDLWQDFERHHVEHLRPKSARAYSSWYRLHIAPALGSTKLGALTRGRIEALLRAVAERAGGSTSNRVAAVLSAMLSWGENATDATGERRLFPEAVNCARRIKRHAEPGRERDLTEAELPRLVAYLAASPATEARLLELCLATGCRKGEALRMRWRDVEGSWWTIPAKHSKSRKRQRKPLSGAAIAVLAKLDRRADPFIEVTESRLSHWWLKARTQIGLEDLHIHDLRHAAAWRSTLACRWTRSAPCSAMA